MRKKEELKTVRKTVLMTEKLSKDIECEATERGIKPNAVMNERLSHSKNTLAPPIMAKIQNLANHASRIVSEYAPTESDIIQKEANEIWTFLNKSV